jgi:hypothetical protein
MAIKKMIVDRNARAAVGARVEVTQPSFSYPPTDALADVIVRAWRDTNFEQQLLQRDPNGAPTPLAVAIATTAINGAGFDLERAVVISELEHDENYTMRDDKEVVFVLPNKDRVKQAPAHSLLATAKLLMAATPNGI